MTLGFLLTDPRTLTLAVALATLALFVWNRLRVDVVALLAMAALMVLGVVTPTQGISGFANEATITVAAMLALSAGLLRTGAIDDLGLWMHRAAGGRELRLLLVLLVIVIPVSALINNTAAVAVLLPVVMGVARSMDVAPSKVLMPLSFAGQMGGTLTLVGTSTNLLVAGLILDLGMDRIRIFDITAPAAILTLAGVAYLLTVGRWLTPVRKAGEDLVDAYQLRAYLASFRVLENSPLAGTTLAESRLGEREGILVVGILRGGTTIRRVGGATRVEAGDELLVEGSVSNMARFVDQEGLEVITTDPEWEFDPGEAGAEAEEDGEDRILAELLVRPGSFPENRPLARLGVRSRWGITILGLQRRGRPLRKRLLRTPLRAGDVLLVEGGSSELRAVHQSGDFSLLGSVDVPARRRARRGLAVTILAAVVLAPAVGLVPIVVSSVVGVAVMFLTGCLTPEEAYEEMDWMVIVLLGAILPLGIAMQETGAAALLVQASLAPMEAVSPTAVLAGFYFLTMLLTGAISNNAAAVVMTPLAVASGLALGVSPLPFVIAVMFAASNSFFTPIGYQTNLFIFGPGGYRFVDFVRVGGPLGLLLLGVATFVIPMFFPF
jgi:di/tricarboxylate transporter